MHRAGTGFRLKIRSPATKATQFERLGDGTSFYTPTIATSGWSVRGWSSLTSAEWKGSFIRPPYPTPQELCSTHLDLSPPQRPCAMHGAVAGRTATLPCSQCALICPPPMHVSTEEYEKWHEFDSFANWIVPVRPIGIRFGGGWPRTHAVRKGDGLGQQAP